MSELLGEVCKDKITKCQGVCTAYMVTIGKYESYFLEPTNGSDLYSLKKDFTPMWVEASRLVKIEKTRPMQEDEESIYETEDLEKKRGQIFRTGYAGVLYNQGRK